MSSRLMTVPEDALRRELVALVTQRNIAEQALRDIVRCDYRGNEPHEQMIARLALADLERERR